MLKIGRFLIAQKPIAEMPKWIGYHKDSWPPGALFGGVCQAKGRSSGQDFAIKASEGCDGVGEPEPLIDALCRIRKIVTTMRKSLLPFFCAVATGLGQGVRTWCPQGRPVAPCPALAQDGWLSVGCPSETGSPPQFGSCFIEMFLMF